MKKRFLEQRSQKIKRSDAFINLLFIILDKSKVEYQICVITNLNYIFTERLSSLLDLSLGLSSLSTNMRIHCGVVEFSVIYRMFALNLFKLNLVDM